MWSIRRIPRYNVGRQGIPTLSLLLHRGCLHLATLGVRSRVLTIVPGTAFVDFHGRGIAYQVQRLRRRDQGGSADDISPSARAPDVISETEIIDFGHAEPWV